MCIQQVLDVEQRAEFGKNWCFLRGSESLAVAGGEHSHRRQGSVPFRRQWLEPNTVASPGPVERRNYKEKKVLAPQYVN